MKRYFVLGAKASVFYDPDSQLKVVSSDPKAPDEFDGKMTPRIEEAMRFNHIIEVKPNGGGRVAPAEAGKEAPKETKKLVKTLSAAQAKEVEDEQEGEDENEDNQDTGEKVDITKMDKDQLLAYYKENYDVSPADEEAFKKLKLKGMIKFLQEEE